MYVKAEKFWAVNNDSFPTALQMWLFWELLVREQL